MLPRARFIRPGCLLLVLPFLGIFLSQFFISEEPASLSFQGEHYSKYGEIWMPLGESVMTPEEMHEERPKLAKIFKEKVPQWKIGCWTSEKHYRPDGTTVYVYGVWIKNTHSK